jgi:hypothetical protein
MKSRLKKIADGFESGGVGGAGDFGSAMPIFMNNPEELINNKDEIRDVTFGPSISREWKFEEPTDYAEWQLQTSSYSKRLIKKH